MRKVHVVLKKEDVISNNLRGKQVVVFDVLMATSVITFLLAEGAEGVYPVLNEREALRKYKEMPRQNYLLVGEDGGIPIKDFLVPSPTLLRSVANENKFILSTTNGTVALRKSSKARKLYASSLLNNKAVAKVLLQSKEDIIVVCAGSSGKFNMEDFIGAGHLIHHLLDYEEMDLTDAARAAIYFFQGQQSSVLEVLLESSVGRQLAKYGLEMDVEYVAMLNKETVVPVVQSNGWIVNEEKVWVG